jgi:hypothetical protein
MGTIPGAGELSMKQFKARIENKEGTIHAIELWFQHDNMLSAAKWMTEQCYNMGEDPDHVTKLIELDS